MPGIPAVGMWSPEESQEFETSLDFPVKSLFQTKTKNRRKLNIARHVQVPSIRHWPPLSPHLLQLIAAYENQGA